MKRKGGLLKQRLALGVVCVLVFAYTIYHLTTLFGDELSTYAAGITTETTVLNYNGYVFRDETVLTSPYSGVVDYHAEDGTKVSKGQTLATVYENGTADVREQIRRVDEQIAVLEASVGSSLNGSDMGELKESVGNTYTELVKMLAAGETGGLADRAERLLVEINQMEALSKKEDASGYATLESLRDLRNSVFSDGGASQTHIAERSGYFYAQTDGYEGYYTIEAAQTLTAESFYELAYRTPSKPTGGETAYGKISYDNEWMLVMPVDVRDGAYFEEGKIYRGLFEENNQTEIPLTLERIVDASADAYLLLVFRADRLPDRFSFERRQNVRLEVDRVSGIYVPKTVVEWIDGERGVYILRGSVVHFRFIKVLYEGSDYYLVRADMEDDEESAYLQVNDMIILNGKNMFDGRVMD